MRIQNMFADDINRKIGGVIRVDQDNTDVIGHELKEYVITNELKKHFMSFFNYYSDAFDGPTDDIGVWISGFFGSGKSHFLKMLSYILENREVNGIKTVERFREKFADDPLTFALIDKATHAETETILFNIDVEGSINKDKTAVLRVFAKVFYDHLGFYGDNLKVAMLESYIDQQGRTEAFRQAVQAKSGKDWQTVRRAFAFNGRYIVPALVETLDMSEEDAKAWFNDKSAVEFSIAQLVEEIRAYVKKKPKDFRLLFMIDEVGQYVGTDTDMLLNLQSLTEEIGASCYGKVWVVCTGQEALDEIIKVRSDEFSRIQARFKTRLSLSSSSVDEVIQKRILKKKPEAERVLERVYEENDSVLRNLFSFSNSRQDIKGFKGTNEFVINFPFVPYQFIIMQKVFAEIRKHGNAGKHLSGGERSMLSGFQEAAQKVQEENEYALVPFFRFYDTVHGFLDGAIRRVIERCARAAENNFGIQAQDVDVLKLLYLIRYIDDDIASNLDNIVILMADNIQVDKIAMRKSISESLDRLLAQNYISRTGDTYNFLTDEEQDIQRVINDTHVDTAAIVERIGNLIYGDLYTTKKFRYGKYDFAFDQMVDDVTVGSVTGGMRLRFLTEATDETMKSEFRLIGETKGKEAAVVLADTRYYNSLESAMKIRKYIKQHTGTKMQKSVEAIIRGQQDEAGKYEQTALEQLKKAIAEGEFYADGERLRLKGDAKAKIDQTMEYLVSHVYSELGLITRNAETDADVRRVLNGEADDALAYGLQHNQEAAEKMFEYLDMQDRRRLPTSMADIQSRYSAIPYGWREIDIAAVAAKLIYDQRVTIKYAGMTIQPTDARLVDMLRKKTEIGKTIISKRHVVSDVKIRKAREFLREYYDVMDVPADENGLIQYIVEAFTKQKAHYEELDSRYQQKNYPDRSLIQRALELTNSVLSQRTDNEALIDRLLDKQDDLADNREDAADAENFFATQVDTFDHAVRFLDEMKYDLQYIARNQEANQALNTIRLICLIPANGKYNYRRIPELNALIASVRTAHGDMLEEKRDELYEVIRQCLESIHEKAGMEIDLRPIVQKADAYYTQQKQLVAQTESLALLDGLMPPMWTYQSQTLDKIESFVKPAKPKDELAVQPKKMMKAVYRQTIFPARRLETKQDIDDYVEQMRRQLLHFIEGCDGIDLK